MELEPPPPLRGGGLRDHAEFDLFVLLVVAGVMPLGVYLLRFPTRLTQCAAIVLLLLSGLWVGLFEHWRLHTPDVTQRGLSAALGGGGAPQSPLWPASGMDLAWLGEGTTNSTGASPAPMMVHLANAFTGARFLERVWEETAERSCGGDHRCAAGWKQRHRTVRTAQPEDLARIETNIPYRAVFTVRDPRDVAVSLASYGGARRSSASAAAKTHEFLAYARASREFARLALKNVTFVKLEELLAPETRRARFAELAAWFGLRGAEADNFVAACESVASSEQEAFKGALAPGSWRTRMKPREADAFLRLHGSFIRGLGYDDAPPTTLV